MNSLKIFPPFRAIISSPLAFIDSGDGLSCSLVDQVTSIFPLKITRFSSLPKVQCISHEMIDWDGVSLEAGMNFEWCHSLCTNLQPALWSSLIISRHSFCEIVFSFPFKDTNFIPSIPQSGDSFATGSPMIKFLKSNFSKTFKGS